MHLYAFPYGNGVKMALHPAPTPPSAKKRPTGFSVEVIKIMVGTFVPTIILSLQVNPAGCYLLKDEKYNGVK